MSATKNVITITSPISKRTRIRQHLSAGLLDSLLHPPSPQPNIEEDRIGKALRESIVTNNLPSPVAVVSIPNQGRGLVATKPLRKGEIGVCLPWSEVITPQRAAAHLTATSPPLSVLGPVEEDIVSTLPAWSLIALFLADLLLLQQQRAQITSDNDVLACYTATLPSSTGCVLEWSDEQVEAWLQGSYLHTLGKEIRKAFETSWDELSSLPTPIPKDLGRHCFALVLSRLIRVDTEEVSGSTEVVAPFIDLINHSSTSTSFLSYDATLSGIVWKADKEYKSGEQIFASYGQKTNGELLLSYGFIPDTNPYDACLIEIEQNVFPVRMGAVPQEMIDYFMNSGNGSGNGSEKHALQCIIDTLKSKKYGITIEDAKNELDEIQNTIDGRTRAMVLRVLIQEQKIIARTTFLLKQRIKTLS